MSWTIVYENPNERMERAAVEGGWLYRNWIRQGSEHGGYSWTITMAFVTAAP